MPTVAVLADPPVEGFVLDDIVDETPLSAAAATRLYEAMLADVCRAVQAGGADLLVNYRQPDQVPDGVDSEAALREFLTDLLDSPDEARYEVQVGETTSGRIGNTVSHLLTEEDKDGAAVVEPTAAFLSREHLGASAMQLRSSEVALGPTTDGRVYFAGFTEPIDFEDAYAPPAVETLTDRASDAGLDVGFMQMLPVLETGEDLLTAVSLLRAKQRAGRNVPPLTAGTLDDLGVQVIDGEVAVGSDSS
ncbi:hypothetical protein ACKVMT_02200 [Halobacteriales archaeon Cl-PHB]